MDEVFITNAEGVNIINTAKHEIEREIFDAMAKYTKALLEQQLNLEDTLSDVKSKLKKIEEDPAKFYKENSYIVNNYKKSNDGIITGTINTGMTLASPRFK